MKEDPYNVVSVVPGGVATMAHLMTHHLGAKAEQLHEDLYWLTLPEPYGHTLSLADATELTSVGGFDSNVIVTAPTPELFEMMKVLGVPMALLENDVWDEAIAVYHPPAT